MHLWFDELENMSAASSSLPEGVLSPTGTGVTPVPVVAHWFTHSDFDEKSDSLSRSKSQNPQTNSKIEEKFVVDDIDTRSVKSDTTVIENLTSEYQNQEEEYETTTVQYNQHQAYNMSTAGRIKAQVAAPEQVPAPVMALAPVLAPASMQTPAPVLAPAPVRTPAPVLPPAPLMDPTPVMSPASAAAKDQIITPTPKKPAPSSKQIISSNSTLNSDTANVQELMQVHNSKPASGPEAILKYCKKQSASSSSAHGLESAQVQDTAAVHTLSSVPGTQSDPLSTQDEAAGVIIVPQSPAEIRKKFQQQDSFEKKFP